MQYREPIMGDYFMTKKVNEQGKKDWEFRDCF